MHLNYNLGIRSSGHFSLQKVSSLCEGEGVGQFLCKLFYFFFFLGVEGITSLHFFDFMKQLRFTKVIEIHKRCEVSFFFIFC